MDKFVTAKKPATAPAATGKEESLPQRQKFKYSPYGVRKADERRFETWKDRKRTEKILAPIRKKRKKKRRPGLRRLGAHETYPTYPRGQSNPITHSDIYNRTDHIVSAATGHQQGDGRGPGARYMKARDRKLAEQLPETSSQVLRGVRVYINGYLENTTDIEMKRIVALAGGEVQRTASGATHVLTSQQLSGTKTHKHLTSKSKAVVHVVRPEWVSDSIAAGRRVPEREYAVVKSAAVAGIADMFRSAAPNKDGGSD
ncbi:uncharacterized protein BXZ73DRAFT_92273 [Epithele typhae]|uniref:uncharacterized protein n=1 Tax=Epithele typhae TaxID=378194 RepID=UPI002008D539|nr:uncharacterized protein BXZ73DRAFT_92273 [Epithele typhae]KAH9918216.1 hypothetical protein BXZ73DRAFT_92273 [Epithele typhae]